MRYSYKLVLTGIALCLVSGLATADKLKSRDYAKRKDTMGVVLVDVNWGRNWDCGGYENAQLTSLGFERVSGPEPRPDDKDAEIVLKSPSRLLANPRFSTYGFIVHPGVYALTDFEVKAALSRSNSGSLKAERAELLKDGEYHGGTLRVAAGEVVYVGHFGLDCFQQPTPWRYYVEGEAAFDEYVAHVRKKFKFLKEANIVYRPFATLNFGGDYFYKSGIRQEGEAEYEQARDSFQAALEFARTSGADSAYLSAVLYNLGRMHGYSCDFDTAKGVLIEALQAERALDEPPDANLSKRLSELARLSFDMNEFAASADYYAQATEYLEELSIASSDPIGYASYLSAYAVVLDKTGAVEMAEDVRARAQQLLSENQGKEAVFVAVEYRDVCAD